ncbi:MAG: hypothetical protein ABIL22_06385, partial [candidate division WOR-3 bacterium]
MNKINIVSLHNLVEEQSQYLKFLAERYMDPVRFQNTITDITEGLKFLDFPAEVLKLFQDLKIFYIWLGGPITQYKDYEWALYIGHKKKGLPIPAGLKEKCPELITNLIENLKTYRTIYEFNQELKNYSMSYDIFLLIHKSIMNARV